MSGRHAFRRRTWSIRVALCCAQMCLAAASVAAQSSAASPRESGLHAGLAFGGADVSFGDAPGETHMAWRVDFGWRWKWKAIAITPKAGLISTHLRGMDPIGDSFAYANVDVALRVTALPRWRIRPYAEVRRGTHTAERLDANADVLNYSGTGTAFGAGLEIPLTPQGRGLEIGFNMARGRYDDIELRRTHTPADLRSRSVSLFVGWSGRFTGISLPWQ